MAGKIWMDRTSTIKLISKPSYGNHIVSTLGRHKTAQHLPFTIRIAEIIHNMKDQADIKPFP